MATEAKLLAALLHAGIGQTIPQLRTKTGISASTIGLKLRQLAYQDMVYKDLAGWQLSLRGRRAISAPRYHDIVAGLRPERHNLERN